MAAGSIRLSRRGLLLGAAALALRPLAAGALNLDDPFPPAPTDLAGFGDVETLDDLRRYLEGPGGTAPSVAKRKLAQDVLAGAPYDVEPYRVAEYFRDVGQGQYGAELRPYARAWPVQPNPVIVEFFRATRTDPLQPGLAGDDTFWCAAFVNWCIARGLSKTGSISEATLRHTTRSASSGSFRCWEQEATPAPAVGDVVVWAQDGTVTPCRPGTPQPGAGHVAFYLGRTEGEGLVVIGANQRRASASDQAQAAIRKLIPATYSYVSSRTGERVIKRLHSIRTAPFLR